MEGFVHTLTVTYLLIDKFADGMHSGLIADSDIRKEFYHDA